MAIEMICSVVLLLAIKDTFRTLFLSCSTINCLSEEITNSLEIIIITGMVINKSPYKETSQINKVHTNSLSANKSKSAPSRVSALVFLAIYPSKKSVAPAIKNNPNAIIFEK